MEINQRVENGIVILSVEGRLDAVSAGEADRIFKDVLQGAPTRLLVDLSDLEYISSAGLRVLLTAAKEMKRLEGHMVLCSLKTHIQEIFDVSGFSSIIVTADTVEAGLQMLS